MEDLDIIVETEISRGEKGGLASILDCCKGAFRGVKRKVTAVYDLLFHWDTLKSLAIGGITYVIGEVFNSVFRDRYPFEDGGTDNIGVELLAYFIGMSAHFMLYAKRKLKYKGKPLEEELDYDHISKDGAKLVKATPMISSILAAAITGLCIGLKYNDIQSARDRYDAAVELYNTLGYVVSESHLDALNSLESINFDTTLLPFMAAIFPVAYYFIKAFILTTVGGADKKYKHYSGASSKGVLNRLMGRHEEAKKACREAYERFPNTDSRQALASIYINEGDFDAALELLTESLENRVSPLMHSVTQDAGLVVYGMKYFTAKAIRPSWFAGLAIESLAYSSSGATIDIFEEQLRNYKESDMESLYYRIIYARTLGIMKQDKRAKEQWRKIIAVLEKRFGKEVLGRGASEVYAVKSGKEQQGKAISKEYALAISEERGRLESRKEYSETLAKWIGEYNDPERKLKEDSREYSVVRSLVFLPEIKDGKHLLVMIREAEEVLTKRIKSEKESEKPTYSDYCAVVRLMAYLHDRLPEREGLGRINIMEDAENKLNMLTEYLSKTSDLLKADLHLDRSVRDQILIGFSKIEQALISQPYCVNGDTTPDNRIVNKNQVVILDSERRKVVPAPLDFVNLVIHSDLPPEKVLVLANYYGSCRNEFAGRQIITQSFEGAYKAGYMPKTISFCTVFSDLHRVDDWGRRPHILDQGIYMAKTIGYEGIRQGFERIKEIVECSNRLYNEGRQKKQRSSVSG